MKHKLLLIIFSLCFLASIILAFMPVEEICGPTTSSCSVVQSSNYEQTFGISNSYFGIVGFLALIFLTISQMRNPKNHKYVFLKVGIIVSTIVAIYFLYLQFFVLKAICKYCMIVDIGSILALVAIYAMKEK